MARTFYDEMYDASDAVRPHYQTFARWLADTPDELLAQRRREADLLFHRGYHLHPLRRRPGHRAPPWWKPDPHSPSVGVCRWQRRCVQMLLR